ncbi:hypothetical protein GOBAR_DD03744 [Gossypium barbadense]|nr:hypothetical protein GOBAR_DD03744 [Gossypium barbadense]
MTHQNLKEFKPSITIPRPTILSIDSPNGSTSGVGPNAGPSASKVQGHDGGEISKLSVEENLGEVHVLSTNGKFPIMELEELHNSCFFSKLGKQKRDTKTINILKGKGSRFKVKAPSRVPVVEAMNMVANKIGNEVSKANLGCNHGSISPSCADPKFVRIVKNYFVEFKVDVVAFLMTRINGTKVDGIIAKIGMDRSHRIEAQSFAGGVWVCWSNNV